VLNNDTLRRFRYALNINDSTMIEIFKISGVKISQSELISYLKRDDEEGYINLSDRMMTLFLDGFIILKRGKREEKPNQNKPPLPELSLTNNLILKKLRIALELKEVDILKLLKVAQFEVSKSELSALFRKEGHRNYKECKDQFLKYFIKGLTILHRN
jgi:uncharacterized protein YehS (DUF1456 family)